MFLKLLSCTQKLSTHVNFKQPPLISHSAKKIIKIKLTRVFKIYYDTKFQYRKISDPKRISHDHHIGNKQYQRDMVSKVKVFTESFI
jgi:hypothetical protein